LAVARLFLNVLGMASNQLMTVSDSL